MKKEADERREAAARVGRGVLTAPSSARGVRVVGGPLGTARPTGGDRLHAVRRVTDVRHGDVPAWRVGVHDQGVDADKRREEVAVALVGFPKRRVETVRRRQEADRSTEEVAAFTREVEQAGEGGAATCVVAAELPMKSSLSGSGAHSVEFMLADFLRGHAGAEVSPELVISAFYLRGY